MIFYYVSFILVILPIIQILISYKNNSIFFYNLYEILEAFTDSILFKIYYFFVSILSIIIVLSSEELEIKCLVLIFCQVVYIIFRLKKEKEENNSIIKTKFGNIYFSSKEINYSDENNIEKDIFELREKIKEMKEKESD